jgi:DNA gyrase subunit A
MLLNGSEGIGTGFSSAIPSFHHKDICASMIQIVQTGKPKKISPYVHYYSEKIQNDNGKFQFPMRIEEIDGKIFITELPRGYDATKTYRYLTKHIDNDYIKDFIDSSVDNDVLIELIFKRGAQPPLKEVIKTMGITSSLSPNYTLISERGVKIFKRPEEILEIFTAQRLEVVKIRYELLSEEFKNKIRQNNEIIKFIKNKEYIAATKSANRKTFVDYLAKKKYFYSDYLADMPIYRMTKEEVSKRALMIKEDSKKLKEFQKIAGSKTLIKKKLVEELTEVNAKLTDWMKLKDAKRRELYKKLDKKGKKPKATKKKARKR